MVSERSIYELEMKRISALVRGDALDYFNSCNALNVIPEERKLYDMGMEEHRFRSGVFDQWRIELSEKKFAENALDFSFMRKIEEWKTKSRNRRYLEFYESAKDISLDLKDEIEKKTQLLADFDPERYGLNGAHSFKDRNNKLELVGNIFYRVFSVAEKKFKLNRGNVK